jgi:threonine 3-dehydrogenase
MNMLAVVKKAPAPGATLEQRPIPEPGPDEILIKVKLAAICGTDQHVYQWDNWAANANLLIPGIIGHECVGEVVAVGEHVTTIGKGERISVETHIPCGTCHLCKNGKQHICENLRLFGLHTHGCFAEYAAVPSLCARKVPAAIDDETAAVLEPLGVGVHAAEVAQVKGKRVAVLGAGPIGIFSACASLALGADEVYISDIKPYRLTVAERCANVKTWNPQHSSAAKQFPKGNEPDVIIETTGSEHALNEAMPHLRKGGTVVLVGLFPRPVPLSLSSDVVFKEAAIYGIHGRKMWETWDLMEDLLLTGKLPIKPALTHRLQLTEIHDGFELMKKGSAVKILVSP